MEKNTENLKLYIEKIFELQSQLFQLEETKKEFKKKIIRCFDRIQINFEG